MSPLDWLRRIARGLHHRVQTEVAINRPDFPPELAETWRRRKAQERRAVPSTEVHCASCHAPARRVWAQRIPPRLEPLDAIQLRRTGCGLSWCPTCGRFWYRLIYEPYGGFHYDVLWPHRAADWSRLNETDPALLESWHASIVHRDWPCGTMDNLDPVLAHALRAGRICPAMDSRCSRVPNLGIE